MSAPTIELVIIAVGEESGNFCDCSDTRCLCSGLKKINYVNKEACRDCPLRPRCTRNSFRTVSRLENEAVLDCMDARIARNPDIVRQRRELVEHPVDDQARFSPTSVLRTLKQDAPGSLRGLAIALASPGTWLPWGNLVTAVRTGERPG